MCAHTQLRGVHVLVCVSVEGEVCVHVYVCDGGGGVPNILQDFIIYRTRTVPTRR